ncbi:tetratricopeptide repeat protein [Paracoccaceae bacterium]|nr:tetratricopeptide repeat protein [Paracoccaceae bacterium]
MSNLTQQPQPPQAVLDQIIGLYNQGQFETVLSKAELMINLFPKAVDLYNIQGSANVGLCRYDEASRCYMHGLKIQPNHAELNNNLGWVFHATGNLEKAMIAYDAAIKIQPKYAEAYNNRGTCLNLLKDFSQAIKSFQNAVEINPDYAVAYFNMGNAFLAEKKENAAIKSYDAAIKINPYFAEAHHNIGNIQTNQGEFALAIESLKKASQIKPDIAIFYYDLGIAFTKISRLDSAVENYIKAIKINPNYFEAHNNLGNVLKDKGEFDAAIERYQLAVQINPNSADAYYNLGLALECKQDLPSAIKSYDTAARLKLNYGEALAANLYLRAKVCDWRRLGQDKDLLEALGTKDQHVDPFALLPLEDSPVRHRLRSENYAVYKYPKKLIPKHQHPLKRPALLRIGYFSTNFTQHPVMYLLAKILRIHNRDKFRVYAYSLDISNKGDMRQRIINAVDVFKDVKGKSDSDVALIAQHDKIDIAIDLDGYTENTGSGILAYRAAPIQINYLGYPGTMGADFIDYIIADQNLIPNESQKYYSEKPIYMPHHYQAQDDTLSISEDIPSRSELGLPDNGFVFCAINNTYKITPSEFDIWMRLLQNVDDSVLWLLESNKWAKANLLKEANARGIVSERLVFAQKVSHEKYLAQFQQADLYLDTFNYNAGATASNALWAGLPVITKLGNGYTARMAGSLLASVGLPELITTKETEYEELALKLATNPEQLASIKQKLAVNRSSKPLFNTELFTKHLEDGYQKAYQRYFDGKEPEAIYVPEQV